MFFFRSIYSFLLNKEYRELLITSAVIIGIGATVYHYVEGWRWIDAFYFSIITLTTIGYGDFSPQTDFGKIFTMFYILLGLGMILTFLDTVYSHFEEERTREAKSKSKKDDE